MQELLETLDNPVKISGWFSGYPGSRTNAGVTTNLTYNYDNQLTQYVSGATNLAYLYDALGNRIKKTEGTNITKYIVDSNRSLTSVLAETNASGTITAYYVYGLGVISKIVGTNAYFYQYDGLGSTVAFTDKTGAVVNKYAYDDFGNLATNSTETVANPFKYIGKFGVATDLPDLLYMRARYYMPSVGRFINKDPIKMNVWELNQLLNRYIYTDNNPINRIDPEGEIFMVPAFMVVVKIVAGVITVITIMRLIEIAREAPENPEVPGPAEEPIRVPQPSYQGRCPPPR